MQIFKHKCKTSKAILALVFSLFVLSGTASSSKTLVPQTTQTEQVCLIKSSANNQTSFYKNTAKYSNCVIHNTDKRLALLHFNNLIKVRIKEVLHQLNSIHVLCFLIFLKAIPQTSYEDYFTSITG